MSSPLLSILHGFAQARERDRARYRCPECGAERRGIEDPGESPAETLACWSEDGGIICTGRAVLTPEFNPTRDNCETLRAWQAKRQAGE